VFRVFNDYMGMALDEESIRRLWQRTEGWAAAMQLAALSGTDRNGQGAGADVIEPGGDSRQINDYILTEILERQPADIRDFLLQCSVCRRLCASLCNSMMAREDSQSILDRLVAANLFIIPLDTRNEWFRLHDLFREALSLRLRQSDPDHYQSLLTQAIRWLLDQDYLQEAIIQLIELEDWDWLEQVLELNGNNLIHGGFHELVHRWLQYLPDERTTSNPIAHAEDLGTVLPEPVEPH